MPFSTMMVDPSKDDSIPMNQQQMQMQQMQMQIPMQQQQNMKVHNQIPTITTTSTDGMSLGPHMIMDPRPQSSNIHNQIHNPSNMGQLQPPHTSINPRQPIIEKATYADTEVYECYVRGQETHVVMRRVRDDWVNITQVFKIGNFSKNQRTKILEKESSLVQHEKVQGGYGRFQGTWVPRQHARAIVDKYKISDAVADCIINFVPDPMNPPPTRSKNSVLRRASPGRKIASPSSYNKTTPKKKAHYDSAAMGSTAKKSGKKGTFRNANPSPLQGVVFQTPQQSYMGSQSTGTFNGQGQFGNTGNSTLPGAGPGGIGGGAGMGGGGGNSSSFGVSVSGNSTISHISSNETPQTNGYSASQKPLQFYPVPTSVRPPSSNSNTLQFANGNGDVTMPSTFVNEHGGRKKTGTKKGGKKKPTASTFLNFVPEAPGASGTTPDFSMQSVDPQSVPVSQSDSSQQFSGPDQIPSRMIQTPPPIGVEEYKNLILQTLSSEVNANDEAYSLPVQLFYPPQDFDVDFLIDDQGHTSLHWAAAMANIPLLQLLLNANANALHYNTKGFNAVTKALFYNNNFKNNSFHSLLSAMKICLITPDNNGRLPLHYLVELSVNKSKDPAIINTYTETLLQVLGNEGYSLLEIALNCQDQIGNTPLHLAALNLNISLFNKLCLLGASTSILNIDKQSPVDILSGFNLIIPSHPKPEDSEESAEHEQGQEQQQELLKSPHQEKSKRKPKKKAATKKKSTAVKTPSQSASTPIPDLRPQFTEDATNTSLNMISVEDISSVDIFANPAMSVPVSSTITKNYSKHNLLSPQGVLTPSKIPNIESPFPIQHDDAFHRDDATQKNGSVESPGKRADGRNKVRKSTFLASPHFASLNENARHFANLVAEDDISRQTQSKLREMSNLTGVRKMVVDLNEMVMNMTSNIEENVSKVVNETNAAENDIQLAQHQNKSVKDQTKDICFSLGVSSILDAETQLTTQEEDVREKQSQLAKTMERTQALTLAKVMQEEEHISETEQDAEADDKSDLIKHAVRLSLLQLKRQLRLKKIEKLTSHLTTTKKIDKYRKLMGMGYDGIEENLDQIEKDLAVDA